MVWWIADLTCKGHISLDSSTIYNIFQNSKSDDINYNRIELKLNKHITNILRMQLTNKECKIC